ncbi:MAG: hypothetical protein IPO21_18705 [Bacteroidales bacterium]|nr:hypothetical protein [Bacteroidales bacterium]
MSHKLTWSHYYELLKVEDNLAREFYENKLFQKIGLSENCEDKRKQVYFIEWQ